jgi:hypothetical protein
MGKHIIPNEDWKVMSPEERLRGLLDMTLDQIHEILEEPPDYRQGVLMSAKVSIIRAILHTCVKLGIEERRAGPARSAVLASITKQMRDEAKTAGAPKTIDVLDEPIH